tara:strand:+ start:2194 stop:3120 length:927 start_codon:yes stop_codon:yes gene_type:complete
MSSTINRPGMTSHLAQETLLDGIYQKSIDAADAKTKEEEEAAAAAVVAADEAAANEGLFTKNLFENWIAPSDISTTEDADKVKARSLVNDAVILTSDGKMDDNGNVIVGAVEEAVNALFTLYQSLLSEVTGTEMIVQGLVVVGSEYFKQADDFRNDVIIAQTKVKTFLANFETVRLAEEPSSEEEAYSSLSKALNYMNNDLISYIKFLINTVNTDVIVGRGARGNINTILGIVRDELRLQGENEGNSQDGIDITLLSGDLSDSIAQTNDPTVIAGINNIKTKLSEFRIMIGLQLPEEDLVFKGNFCAS